MSHGANLYYDADSGDVLCAPCGEEWMHDNVEDYADQLDLPDDSAFVLTTLDLINGYQDAGILYAQYESESDYPEHCAECDELLDYVYLTNEGYEYVATELLDFLDQHQQYTNYDPDQLQLPHDSLQTEPPSRPSATRAGVLSEWWAAFGDSLVHDEVRTYARDANGNRVVHKDEPYITEAQADQIEAALQHYRENTDAS